MDASQSSSFVSSSSLPTSTLKYTIDSWSSHSAHYHPCNILVDDPKEQASRWSSGSNNQMQFVMLKLDQLAVVAALAMGKYHKMHVCNLKEFKVYGGLTPTNLAELLHSGLRNDDEPEIFPLVHQVNGILFPCRYIKIVPLLAWGANFNFSIWHVGLRGCCTPSIAEAALARWTRFREIEVIRLCLKHFRQCKYLDAFDVLRKQTNVQLEHPLLTELYCALVTNGDFDCVEAMMSSDPHLYDEYISDCLYVPLWSQIHPINSEGEPAIPGVGAPCMRGGHQMCIDVTEGLIYLDGGWDGSKDLADLWVYSQTDNIWTCLSHDTTNDGGPRARSCHKVCFDEENKKMYVLGHYVLSPLRSTVSLRSEFYVYNAISDEWRLLSSDTAKEGGPELIYDHQMDIDLVSGIIYVFGGRIISGSQLSSESQYSGLYLYNIATNTWSLKYSDSNQPRDIVQLKSRIGHSMLVNQEDRNIYLFAGQRNKDYMSDFYTYSMDTGVVSELSRDASKQGGPEPGFTQRTTIDSWRGELYVLSGLMLERNSSLETVKNSFWVYHIRRRKWFKIYQNEHVEPEYWNSMNHIEPCPRFAHQLCYDSSTASHYLFGGNPGESGNPSTRLDDFWLLKLSRPSYRELFRRCQFLIRKQRFVELCHSATGVETLQYLRGPLSACVDHSDDKESRDFRALTATMFQAKTNDRVDSDGKAFDVYESRIELYHELLKFFPTEMKQPEASLIDLLAIQGVSSERSSTLPLPNMSSGVPSSQLTSADADGLTRPSTGSTRLRVRTSARTTGSQT